MKIATQLLLAVLLFSSSLSVAQLTGIYTIDNTGAGDFNSFTKAVDSLIAVGVNGPVTFQVADGTYDDQFIIPEITGAGNVNTITFTSASADSSKVILEHPATSSSNNYLIHLNGADYITFEKITLRATNDKYQRLLFLDGGANNNSFSNLQLLGDSVDVSSSLRALVYTDGIVNDTNNVFSNSYFSKGSYAFYLLGTGAATSAGPFVINNNIFEDQFGAAIYTRYVGGLQISGNSISSFTGNDSYYGIQIRDADSRIEIMSNQIIAPDAQAGIYLYRIKPPMDNGLIANNMVSIANPAFCAGLQISLSGTHDVVFNNIRVSSPDILSRALYLQSSNLNNFYNNIFFHADHGYVFYGLQSSTVDNSDHNAFYSRGANPFYLGGVNYNSLDDYSTGTGNDMNSLFLNPFFSSATDLHVQNPLLKGAGVPKNGITMDLDGETRNVVNPDIGADEFTVLTTDVAVAEVVAPTGALCSATQDVSVRLFNLGAGMLSNVDVQWTVNDTAQIKSGFTGSLASGADTVLTIGSYTFKDGVPASIRVWSENPNSMADQNNSNDTAVQSGYLYPGLSGTYTVGGSSPDFSTLTAAVQRINDMGICGPVTLDLRPGIYDEQIKFSFVRGVSPLNTITIQSESGNKDDVEISHTNNSADENYIIDITATDHIIIQNLTIAAKSNTYGRVIVLNGKSSGIQILNNTLQGSPSSTQNTSRVLIHADDSEKHDILISGNELNWASYGIILQAGNVSAQGSNIIIENNLVANANYTGIFVERADSVIIRDNKVWSDSPGSSFRGIHLMSVDKGSKILKNRITAKGGAIGLYAYFCDGVSGDEILVANNFIHMGGSGAVDGIYYYGCDYFKTYHNSINITSSDTTSKAFRIFNNGKGHLVRNNNFANNGGGYSIYLHDLSDVDTCDYNNLYTTGSTIGYSDNGNALKLADWVSSANLDSNSISVEPLYSSESDLHSCQAQLNLAGTSIPEVGNDIDGETRHATYPTIGADEFANTALTGVDLGNDTTICKYDTLILDAGKHSPGTLYDWSTGENTSSILFNGADTVRVQIYNGCESKMDTVIISNYDISVSLGMDTTICETDSVLLTAVTDSTGLLFSWSTGAMFDSIWVTAPDTVWVKAESSTCYGLDTVIVFIDSSITVSLGKDTSFCSGDTLELYAGSRDSYSWSTGDSTQNIVAKTSDTIWVEVATGACRASDTVIVTVHDLPILDAGADQGVCFGDSVEIQGMASTGSVVWDPVESFSDPNILSPWYYPVKTSIIYLTGTDSNGCSGVDSALIEVYPLPKVDLGEDTILHPSDSMELNAMNPGGEYTWSTGDSSQKVWIGFPTDTVYVELVDSNGCPASDTIYLDWIVGIDEYESVQMEIFPNPVSENLYINVPMFKGKLAFKLSDLSGKIVGEYPGVSGGQAVISLEGLSAGVYVLTAINGDLRVRKKIIKK